MRIIPRPTPILQTSPPRIPNQLKPIPTLINRSTPKIRSIARQLNLPVIKRTWGLAVNKRTLWLVNGWPGTPFFTRSKSIPTKLKSTLASVLENRAYAECSRICCGTFWCQECLSVEAVVFRDCSYCWWRDARVGTADFCVKPESYIFILHCYILTWIRNFP